MIKIGCGTVFGYPRNNIPPINSQTNNDNDIIAQGGKDLARLGGSIYILVGLFNDGRKFFMPDFQLFEQ